MVEFLFFIKMKELADHPIGVGNDPEHDCEVVVELGFDLPVLPRNKNGYRKCRDNHGEAEWFDQCTPANVLDEPENDVKVFCNAIAFRDDIQFVGFGDVGVHIGKSFGANIADCFDFVRATYRSNAVFFYAYKGG